MTPIKRSREVKTDSWSIGQSRELLRTQVIEDSVSQVSYQLNGFDPGAAVMDQDLDDLAAAIAEIRAEEQTPA